MYSLLRILPLTIVGEEYYLISMPQEFQVLQCYKCETFQVHQVKKVLKWNCKLCGEKQSVKKVYGRGTGVDCRKHVQQLNTMRGELASLKEASSVVCPHADADYGEENQLYDHHAGVQPHLKNMASIASGSKWSQYADDNQEVTESDDEVDASITTDRQYFTNQRKAARKRKQTDNKSTLSKYSKWESKSDELDTDFHYSIDSKPAFREPNLTRSVHRLSESEPENPFRSVFGTNRGSQHARGETRYQGDNENKDGKFESSGNSRSKWEQDTENEADFHDSVDIRPKDDIKSEPEMFHASVNAKSKWGQYTETETDFQDSVDYGTEDHYETHSEWDNGNKAVTGNTSAERDQFSDELENGSFFKHENDNVNSFKRRNFDDRQRETESCTTSSLDKTKQVSFEAKQSLVLSNNSSKWSKFVTEDNEHVTDDENDFNFIGPGGSHDHSEFSSNLHQPIPERYKIHRPLTETNRSDDRTGADSKSLKGSSCMEFSLKDMTEPNLKVSHSDKNSVGQVLPAKESAFNQKENKPLFTVGELSDDFDL